MLETCGRAGSPCVSKRGRWLCHVHEGTNDGGVLCDRPVLLLPSDPNKYRLNVVHTRCQLLRARLIQLSICNWEEGASVDGFASAKLNLERLFLYLYISENHPPRGKRRAERKPFPSEGGGISRNNAESQVRRVLALFTCNTLPCVRYPVPMFSTLFVIRSTCFADTDFESTRVVSASIHPKRITTFYSVPVHTRTIPLD